MSIYVLWLMCLIYNIYGYVDFNPLFGSVFIWALVGIRVTNENINDFREKKIHYWTTLILKIYSTLFVGQIILSALNISWV